MSTDICVSLWNGNILLEQGNDCILLYPDEVEDFIQRIRTIADSSLDFYAQPE